MNDKIVTYRMPHNNIVYVKKGYRSSPEWGVGPGAPGEVSVLANPRNMAPHKRNLGLGC